MNTPRRAAFTLALALILAPVMVITGPGAPAHAAGPAVTSSVCDPTTGEGVTNSTQMALTNMLFVTLMCKRITQPSSVIAGTSTGTTTMAVARRATAVAQHTVGNSTSSSKVPAFKTMSLAKTISGASIGFVAYDVGVMVGTDAVAAFYAKEGIDTDKLICQQNAESGGLYSILTGTDCSDFQAAAEYALNSDRTATSSTAPLCTPEGLCYSLVGFVPSYSPPLSCWTYSGPGFVSGSGPVIRGMRADGSETGAGSLYSSGGRYTTCKGAHTSTMGGASTGTGTVTFRLTVGSNNTEVARQPVVSTVPDPDRRWKCTVTSTSGSPSVTESAPFSETDAAWVVPDCDSPATGTPSGLKVEQCEGSTCTSVAEEAPTPEIDAARTAYPACYDGSTKCVLDLTSVLGTGTVSCFERPELCQDWSTKPEPARSDQYECRYGPYVAALAECYAYTRVFQPEAVSTGTPYADPLTGADPGVQTGPVPGAPSSESVGSCYPTGWGVLNPVEWVLKPVGCALRDAFVPRPAQVTAANTRVAVAWGNTPMGAMSTVISAWEVWTPSVTGCGGIPVDLDIMGVEGHYDLLSTCEEPLATIAGLTRTVGSAAIIIYSLFAITRHIGGIIGYGGVGKSE